MDLLTLDVDEPERGVARDPDRPLAQGRAGMGDADGRAGLR
jgi:hypothetical protein